jgi:uncharacterized membrane protein YqjE
MCTQLFQIYQKRTPTFLAEIVALVATALLLASPSKGKECGLEGTLKMFYLTVLIVAVGELLLKLIVFAVIYCKNREIANTYNTVVLIVAAVCHLGLWIYSVVLFSNDELGVCRLKDQFFLKCYVFGYGAMIVGGVSFFLILIVPAIWVTFRAVKNARKEKEEE